MSVFVHVLWTELLQHKPEYSLRNCKNIINKEQQTVSVKNITAHMGVDGKFGMPALFLIHLSRKQPFFPPRFRTFDLAGLE